MKTAQVTLLLIILISVCVLGTCPPGFFQHEESCYTILQQPARWSQAMELCEIFGAGLAVIETQREDVYIKGLLNRLVASLPTKEVWLGGTDMLNEGEWIWAKTFEPIKYTRWAPGEPNNGADKRNQHCLGMLKDADFQWDDNFCFEDHVPLCERRLELPWGKDQTTDGVEVIG